jgi:hypothetical protein
MSPMGRLPYRAQDHWTQRSRSRLEALFVRPDVTVKVSLKQPIKSRTFGMSRTVLGGEFCNTPAIQILIRTKVCFGCMRTKGDRLKPEEHGGQ